MTCPRSAPDLSPDPPPTLQAAGQSGAVLGGLAGIRPALPVIPGAPGAAAFGGPLAAAGALTSAAVAQTVASGMQLPGPPPLPGAGGVTVTPVPTSTVLAMTGLVTVSTLMDEKEYAEVGQDGVGKVRGGGAGGCLGMLVTIVCLESVEAWGFVTIAAWVGELWTGRGGAQPAAGKC